MEPVRCADCGFLSLRYQATGELMEADAQVRETWAPSVSLDRGWERFARVPVCYVEAVNFRELIGPVADPVPPQCVLPVIQEPRECSRFVKWHPRHSPKEHQEMLWAVEVQRLQNDQREKDRVAQEQQREKDQAREDARRESDRKWQAKEARKSRRSQAEEGRRNRRWQLIMAIVVAALSGMGWLIGYFVGRGEKEAPQPVIIQLPGAKDAQPVAPAK